MIKVLTVDDTRMDVELRPLSTGAMRGYAEALSQGALALDQAVLFATRMELAMPDGMLEACTGLSREELDQVRAEDLVTLATAVREREEHFFAAWDAMTAPPAPQATPPS